MSQKSVASVVFSGVLWACSGGASDPLVESCSGRYTCTAGATTVETTLVKQTNGCFAGEIRLGADHVATLPSGRQGSWAGSVERFDVCEGSDCVVCTAATVALADAGPRNTYAPSCTRGVDAATVLCSKFDHDPESCNRYGCTVWYGGDGGLVPYCKGQATNCTSLFSENECTARSDCAWE